MFYEIYKYINIKRIDSQNIKLNELLIEHGYTEHKWAETALKEVKRMVAKWVTIYDDRNYILYNNNRIRNY